jgi:hypothetical protein
LYYFAKGWGGLPEGKSPYSPTSIENIFNPATFTIPGTFYYDKAAATFTYLVSLTFPVQLYTNAM